MSKVTFWKSKDGSLHETHQAFLEHEAKAKIQIELEFDKIGAEFAFTDDSGNEVVAVDDLPKLVANNYKLIGKIITDATAVKRPRKEKVAA